MDAMHGTAVASVQALGIREFAISFKCRHHCYSHSLRLFATLFMSDAFKLKTCLDEALKIFPLYVSETNRIIGNDFGVIFLGCLFSFILWMATAMLRVHKVQRIMKYFPPLSRVRANLFSARWNSAWLESVQTLHRVVYNVQFIQFSGDFVCTACWWISDSLDFMKLFRSTPSRIGLKRTMHWMKFKMFSLCNEMKEHVECSSTRRFDIDKVYFCVQF